MSDLPDSYKLGLIIGFFVLIIILCFSVYAASCGEGLAKAALGAIYIVFVMLFFLIGIGVRSAAQRKFLVDQLEFIWHLNNEEPGRAIEDGLDCHCWNVWVCFGNETAPENENEICQAALQRVADAHWKPVSKGCFAVAALMMFAASLAFSFCCCIKKKRKEPEFQSLDACRVLSVNGGIL
jgi:hypothetical protein